MKSVIAFIQPIKEEAVRDALHAVSELSGATFSDVRGFGRGRGRSEAAEEEQAIFGFLPKVRVELMARDSVAAEAVEAISRSAHTGVPGDGKIYVLPVEAATRISTRQTGDAAV